MNHKANWASRIRQYFLPLSMKKLINLTIKLLNYQKQHPFSCIVMYSKIVMKYEASGIIASKLKVGFHTEVFDWVIFQGKSDCQQSLQIDPRKIVYRIERRKCMSSFSHSKRCAIFYRPNFKNSDFHFL